MLARQPLLFSLFLDASPPRGPPTIHDPRTPDRIIPRLAKMVILPGKRSSVPTKQPLGYLNHLLNIITHARGDGLISNHNNWRRRGYPQIDDCGLHHSSVVFTPSDPFNCLQSLSRNPPQKVLV